MIETIRCVDVHITGIKETPTQHDKHISLVGKFGEDAAECVSFAAIPFIYFVSALSFLGAKPAGASVKEYQEHDAWTIGDTVLGIRFEQGDLHFYADYIRGRRMKTTIIVRQDGTFTVFCLDRGDLPLAWIAKLRGDTESQFTH